MSYNAETKMYEGYIYCVTNNQTGKKYIGQTTTTIKNRWSEHIKSSKKGKYYFHKAIKYYGENAFSINELFKITLLKKSDLLSNLNIVEVDTISKYDTLCPNGYNISNGGGSHTYNSCKVCQYTKDGILINTYESITDAASTLNIRTGGISSVCSGRNKLCNGWVFRYYGDDFLCHEINRINLKVPIKKYTLDGVFVKRYDSIGDAARDVTTNIRNGTNSISRCCRGERPTSFGHVFRYENDSFDKYKTKDIPNKVKQYDLDDNFLNLFNSISDASKCTKIERSSIVSACKKLYKTAGGYIWKYDV